MDREQALLEQIRALQRELQAEKMDKYQRRVPLGDLITDRWKNAEAYGFGEGANCYDSSLILGNVKVGRKTWIGPNTILDGKEAALEIGDFCSISAGVQIYTHNAVRWSVQMGAAPLESKPTKIGHGVYIGPNTIVEMGVTIGDKAVIGAMSLVTKDIPAGAKAIGCPARVIGTSEAFEREA